MTFFHPLLALVILAVGDVASAALGDPDLGFNGTGKVITDFGGIDDWGTSVAALSDGRVMVAGYSHDGVSYNFALMRYQTDGTLDTSFGVGGKVITDLGGEDYAQSVKLQSDGKIVAAGRCGSSPDEDFAVVRYHANGSLDSSFGVGGKVITDFGGEIDCAYSVALQSDGKAVVAGLTLGVSGGYAFALVRYLQDGTLDSGFGSGGKVVSNFGSSAEAKSVAVQSDGKIVVAGNADTSGGYDFILARYLADGTLDDDFGDSGKMVSDSGRNPYSGSQSNDIGEGVVVQEDGKIVMAGYSDVGNGYRIILLRCNADGSLDTGFGSGGRVSASVGAGNTMAYCLTLQKDGRLVVAGTCDDGTGDFDLALARFNGDGTLDGSFGSGGTVRTDLGNMYDSGVGIAVRGDGKIIVAGSVLVDTFDFALLSYENTVSASAVTLAASDVTTTTAILHGTVNANEGAGGASATASFELSADGVNYESIAATPAMVNGGAVTAVNAVLTDLIPGTYYRFRVKGVNAGGNAFGQQLNFTTAGPSSNNRNLANLVVGSLTLSPAFANSQLTYTADAPYLTPVVMVTPFTAQPDATVTVNEVTAVSANPSGPISLAVGMTVITVVVTAQDGIMTRTYTVAVTRAPPVPGELDVTFNSTGKVVAAVGGEGESFAIQSDGKIVVAGYSWSPNANFVVLRYHADGSPDSTFGSDGAVTTDFAGKNDYALGMTLQSDSKIVLVGSTAVGTFGYSIAVVRYNADGSLDIGFGSGGKVITNFGSHNGFASSVALQSDGKIVVAGTEGIFSDRDFGLVRYSADGSLDNSFGTGGKVTVRFGTDDDIARCLAVQSDGKILVAGMAGDDLALCCCNADGSLDSGFGIGGKVTIPGEFGSNAGAYDVALQRDGKILVVGQLESDVVLARYHPNGSLDSSFGNDGNGITVVDTFSTGSSLAVQEDGRIMVAGMMWNGLSGDFALARYTADGSIDTGFANGGHLNTDFDGGSDRVDSLALQSDGRMIAVGNSYGDSSSTIVLARYHNALAPTVATLSATNVTASSAILTGLVNANEHAAGTSALVLFEGGLTSAYAASLPAIPSPVTGSTGVSISTQWTNLSPGTTYHYRARGTSSVGTTVGADLTFTTLTTREEWRQIYFGTTANDGNAADLAEPDHDGIKNLVKYGLVITPGQYGSTALPAAQARTYAEGTRLALVFTHDPTRNDIILEVQVSDDLSANGWLTVATSSYGGSFAGPGFVSETEAGGGRKSVEVRDIVNLSEVGRRFIRVCVTH